MCGIAGFNWEDKVLGGKMQDRLLHRGPDAYGLYSDDGITLAHRRLSVIDLSAAANQPMWDTHKEQIIVYNGEIYNYKELRLELAEHYHFVTQSDTEVILAGYKVWGRDVVKHLNGIFALAIWDTGTKTLFVARDHMGIKPLYYYWDGSRFVFASELKAIFEHDIPRTLDLESFNDYLRVLYVPAPKTMIKNIFKLEPGSHLALSGTKLEVERYYTPKIESKHWDYREAREAVRKGVEEAAERQLVADVPVGVYLSGGIDSSAVLESVSRVKQNVKTFSVGFDLDDGEEREKFNRDFELAAETAKFFGAEHHPLTLGVTDVAEHLEEIISAIDDPVSNPTAIAMAVLARFAKQEVTVVLSGNGGDELFGGYERYRMSRRVDVLGSIPGVKYLMPKKIRGAYEMSALDRLAQFEFEKDKRLAKVISGNYLKPMGEVKNNFKKYIHHLGDKTQDLMMADLTSWLPDQALALGDRMSMWGSLEERVPLLDRKVVELALSLPLSYKVTPFETKKILKDAFRRALPEGLFKEPKRGWFSPGAKWLRRPEIQKVAQEALQSSYYGPTSALFNWQGIREVFENHVSKREYNLTIIWAILTFQIWAKKYKVVV